MATPFVGARVKRVEDPRLLTGDGFSYDIFRQAGTLVAPGRDHAVDPLGGLAVRHVVGTGGSQSANRLSTYLNAIQPMGSPYDAFLLTVYAGCR